MRNQAIISTFESKKEAVTTLGALLEAYTEGYLSGSNATASGLAEGLQKLLKSEISLYDTIISNLQAQAHKEQAQGGKDA